MTHKRSFAVTNGLCKSYVTLAWRTLMENKLISLISVAGLMIGLTGSFLIGLFILDELAFDRHLRNKDRLFRVTSTYEQEGHRYNSALTDGYVANNLISQIPEIQRATRLLASDEAFLFHEKSAFKEKIIYTDSVFLDVFGFELIQGNKRHCLTYPSSLIVSEQTASKLFGQDWFGKEVVGKMVSLDGRIPMTVTGVFTDIPAHTHFRSNLFATPPSGQESWMNNESNVYTYALLHPDADRANVRKKLLSLTAASDFPQASVRTRLNLQPVSDIYLFSALQDENALQGNIKNIYALLLIALFLIVITVVNFANLYTANSFARLKEIGVRKTLGAVQMQLQLQFMGETFVITLISLIIAFSATTLFLPYFNTLTGKQFVLSSLLEARVLVLAGGLTLMISLLAGIYPALYLSGRKTVDALKGLKNQPNGSVAFRKGLIMVQFGLSSVMIILSLVALTQINLINEKDVGFDKQNIVALANPYMLGNTEKIISFRNELSGIRGVEEISITGYTPSQKRWGNQSITFPERNEFSPFRHHANWLLVDENFIRTMGIQLL
ncbi:MAG TPA: ABC transporter permease, partial [Chryseosolibacter sp.]|nr:ABC transporter permease [Chryseosolibacter sp.]